MANYITDTELSVALLKKIDKANIATVLQNNPSNERVASEKLLDTKIKEVKYPQNLCDCLKAFDSMYMGYKATHPSTDINGAVLTQGLMYWNTTDNVLYIFNGSQWVSSIATTPSTMPQPYSIDKFDTEVTSVTSTVTVPNGYNASNINVYLNGLRMSTADYTATNGSSITFTQPLKVADVVSGFSSKEDIIGKFDVESTTTTSTITVGTYNPKTISVYLNGIRMSTADYTATDGNTVVFATPITSGSVVSGFFLKEGSKIPLVTEYADKSLLPTPAVNGVLALTLDDKKLHIFSTGNNAWVTYGDNSHNGGGQIGFYDKYDDFPSVTTAITDKLYVDRATKYMWLFDGTKYIHHGVIISKTAPTIATMSETALYVDSDKQLIQIKNGSSIITLTDGKQEVVQEKASPTNFIYTGKQNLFLDTTTHRLYHYDGTNFKPIVSAGAGAMEFVANSGAVGTAENTLYLEKEAGKLYYFLANKKHRANKEIWRIPTDSDLNTAIKDEDFIYLIDDTNLLKKWDAGANRFESLGSSKVIHHFVKESEITKVGTLPTRAEIQTFVATKNWSNAIVWGNGQETATNATTWAYSVDDDKEAVLLYSNIEITVTGFCTIPTESTIGGNKLLIKVEAGNNITVTDGNGATIPLANKTSDGNLSSSGKRIEIFINGVKIPNADITISGNTATVQTSRVLSGTLYIDNFIEINR